METGGAEGNRTPDLYNAIVALSQLSYGPIYLRAAGWATAFVFYAIKTNALVKGSQA